MGIGIREGRDFSEQDSPKSPLVAIISEAMAREYFHGQDPVGQRFYWGDRGLFTIIGVAQDVHISALDADPPAMIYQSMFQMQTWTAGHTAFLLRTSRSGQDLFSEVQQQVWSVDKELPLYKSTTLATLVSDSLAQRRFTMLMLAGVLGRGAVAGGDRTVRRDFVSGLAASARDGAAHGSGRRSRRHSSHGAQARPRVWALQVARIGLLLSAGGLAPADHQLVSRQPLRSGDAGCWCRCCCWRSCCWRCICRQGAPRRSIRCRR